MTHISLDIHDTTRGIDMILFTDKGTIRLSSTIVMPSYLDLFISKILAKGFLHFDIINVAIFVSIHLIPNNDGRFSDVANQVQKIYCVVIITSYQGFARNI